MVFLMSIISHLIVQLSPQLTPAAETPAGSIHACGKNV